MPPGHWHLIAETIARNKNNTLAENARLFALLSMAQADGAIACWEAKFKYNFWRPVTAIARAANDGNDATDAEEWEPLLTTPAHPEYPSGHSAFSGAAAMVLARRFGTDKIAFAVRSDALSGVARNFTSLRACAEECGMSRVYGGIHYLFSCEDGNRMGEQVARGVLEWNNSAK